MNEKLLETLFNRFALQCFRLGDAWVHTPSSREEFVNGYDACIVGMRNLREIVVQFKKPNPTRTGFTIAMMPHQHEKLRSLYPPGTAYYVSATFRDFAEVQTAQRRVKKASEFLRYYVAVEIRDALPADVKFIQYERQETFWAARNVRYKCETDGATRRAPHAVPNRRGWESGIGLIRKFKRRELGRLVRLFGIEEEVNKATRLGDPAEGVNDVWSPSSAGVEQALDVDVGADFPTALRVCADRM
jgi:hypothetical protein